MKKKRSVQAKGERTWLGWIPWLGGIANSGARCHSQTRHRHFWRDLNMECDLLIPQAEGTNRKCKVFQWLKLAIIIASGAATLSLPLQVPLFLALISPAESKIGLCMWVSARSFADPVLVFCYLHLTACSPNGRKQTLVGLWVGVQHAWARGWQKHSLCQKRETMNARWAALCCGLATKRHSASHFKRKRPWLFPK